MRFGNPGGSAGKGHRIGLAMMIFLPLTIRPAEGTPRRFLLADEGSQKIHHLDLQDSTRSWSVGTPGNNRDMQLIGRGRVLCSTEKGYYEIDIATGATVKSLLSFSGIRSARRLPDGRTFLAAGTSPAQLIVLDSADREVKRVPLPKSSSALRLLRLTADGTLLYGNGLSICESDTTGKMKWAASLPPGGNAGVYQASRLPGGRTLVSTGYGASLLLLDSAGAVLRIYKAQADSLRPFFFAGFQVLPGGNIVVANWQGHGANLGASGRQLLEFGSDGNLVGALKPDPSRFSSLHGVLVLDGLDLSRFHPDGAEEKAAPLRPRPSKRKKVGPRVRSRPETPADRPSAAAFLRGSRLWIQGRGKTPT